MESEQKIQDLVLLKRVAKGDHEAYKLLYCHYAPYLMNYLLALVQNSKEDAEEVLQTVFLKIWIKRALLKDIKSFESYVFRMAKNELITLRQRQNKLKEIIQLKDRSDFETSSVHEKVIYDEYLEAARFAIDRLSPQRRRIFEMRTEMDMSIDQIANELDITKSAVKKQLYEAIRFMKTQLEHQIGSTYVLLLLFFLL